MTLKRIKLLIMMMTQQWETMFNNNHKNDCKRNLKMGRINRFRTEMTMMGKDFWIKLSISLDKSFKDLEIYLEESHQDLNNKMIVA